MPRRATRVTPEMPGIAPVANAVTGSRSVRPSVIADEPLTPIESLFMLLSAGIIEPLYSGVGALFKA
jgi:hypothetical protein